MNPSASAPASTAASASSRFVIPQILTLTLIVRANDLGTSRGLSRQQLGHLVANISVFHQRLAHQNRSRAEPGQSLHVRPRVNSTLSHQNFQPWGIPERP